MMANKRFSLKLLYLKMVFYCLASVFAIVWLSALPVIAANIEISLTLDEAIARGLSGNPQIEAYRLAVDEAEEGIKRSRSAFLPTLSMDYSHRRLINSSSGSERDADYLSQHSGTFQVRLTQPLFSSMAGVAGLAMARESRDYRALEHDYMKQQLVRELRSGFYEFLWARERAEKWQESVGRLQRQQQIANAWVDQQLAPRLRLLEIATELAHARQQQVSAQTDLASAAARLRSLMALPAGMMLNLRGELPEQFTPLSEPVEYYLGQAMSRRLELQMAQISVELARQDARVIRARNLPKVSLDAGWTSFDRNYKTSGLPGDDRDFYTISLNVSMRPYQGGATYHAWREQQLKIRRFGQEYFNQKNTIISEIETLYEQLTEGRSRLESAMQGISTAQEAYQFAEQASRIGAASLDTLLNAELRLTRAELDKLDAQHHQQQRLVQFEHALGVAIVNEH